MAPDCAVPGGRISLSPSVIARCDGIFRLRQLRKNKRSAIKSVRPATPPTTPPTKTGVLGALWAFDRLALPAVKDGAVPALVGEPIPPAPTPRLLELLVMLDNCVDEIDDIDDADDVDDVDDVNNVNDVDDVDDIAVVGDVVNKDVVLLVLESRNVGRELFVCIDDRNGS